MKNYSLRLRFPLQVTDAALRSCAQQIQNFREGSQPAREATVTNFILDEGLPELTGTAALHSDGGAQEADGSVALRALNALFDLRNTGMLKAPFLSQRVEPRELAKLRARVRDACRKLAFVSIARSRASESVLSETLHVAYSINRFDSFIQQSSSATK
jgi:hypothetical protein